MGGISRARGGPAWNPLLAHCLDTAAVCGLLFDRYLAAPVRAHLADAFGGGCATTARKVVMLLAALHDMPGKAQPGMQLRFPAGTDRSDPELQQAGRMWEAAARAAGLPLDGRHRRPPHAHVTARYLPALLGCSCSACTHAYTPLPPQGPSAPEHHGLHTIAALLGGHHGHIPDESRICDGDCNLDNAWQQIHRRLLNELAHLLQVDLTELPQLIQPQRPTALVTLAGLVVHGDWIASDESRFTYRTPHTPTTQWWHQAQDQATAAIEDLHLQRWQPQQRTWAALMPDTPKPRPAQQAVIDAAPTGPVMAIIEEATGGGKSETAFWLAHHLARTCGYHGFYLAQATRAASEQITARARTFLTHALGDQKAANLALVHGTASTAAVTQELLDAAGGPATLADLTNITDCADHGAQMVLDAWYLAGGRGLLSTFGIGTIDQIILAAQRSRHWFLRLYGLFNKVVIIDEAHAYELYQQKILGSAIGWLADAGASIIVLSATLSTTIRHALIDAWCTGHRTTASPTTATGPLTLIDPQGQCRTLTPAPRPGKKRAGQGTRLRLVEDPGPEALAERILATHRRGVTGVIRNQVTTATSLYRAAVATAHEHHWDPEKILLLHARFFERDRARHQQRLQQLLGPHPDPSLRTSTPNPHRPDRFLLIGTQVLEQSLDYDLDHLYSDLAPFDLLWQRRGRLWRHLINHLTTRHRTPLMRVLWKPRKDGLPHTVLPGGQPADAFTPYLMAATWHALHQRTPAHSPLRLTAPDDTHPLLRALYDQPPEHGDAPIHQLLHELYHDWQRALTDEENQAQERLLAPYDDDGNPCTVDMLASGPSHADPDDPNHPPHLAARSRLGEPSINITGLYQQPDQNLTWDPQGQLPADLTSWHPYRQPEQHRRQLREILLNTVPLPHRWFSRRNPLPPLHTWNTGHLGPLKNRPVLLLTPNGHPVDPRLAQLTYTPTTGLSRQPRNPTELQ